MEEEKVVVKEGTKWEGVMTLIGLGKKIIITIIDLIMEEIMVVVIDIMIKEIEVEVETEVGVEAEVEVEAGVEVIIDLIYIFENIKNNFLLKYIFI